MGRIGITTARGHTTIGFSTAARSTLALHDRHWPNWGTIRNSCRTAHIDLTPLFKSQLPPFAPWSREQAGHLPRRTPPSLARAHQHQELLKSSSCPASEETFLHDPFTPPLSLFFPSHLYPFYKSHLSFRLVRTEEHSKAPKNHSLRAPNSTAIHSTAVAGRMGFVEDIYGPQLEEEQQTSSVYEYQNTPENRSWAGALPLKQGLYDPDLEKDACGVGFAA